MSDEQLLGTYTRATHPFGFEAASDKVTIIAGLRAVEAAVRADQIEKDAAIAEKQRPWNYTRPDDWTERAHSRAVTANEAAAAIRAQLTEGNGDE